MTDVFVRLLSISLSGALVALIAMALCALARRTLSKTWRYYIWLIVLLRLVVPFAPQGNNLIDVMAGQFATYSTARQVLHTSDNPTPSHGMPDAPKDGVVSGFPPNSLIAPFADDSPQIAQNDDLVPPVESIHRELWRYVWVVWLGVAMLLLVRFITSYHSFTRFIRAGWKPVDDPVVLDSLDEVCAQYGVKRPLPLYLNPLATSPMLVGIVRPVIVLPDCRLEKEKLCYILAHELIHHKRRDIIYKWFVQIVCCLHWFNPIVYLMKKEIGIACELSCDEWVLSRASHADYKQYGDTLLAVMQTSGNYGDIVASATMSEEGKMMKKRLQSIASPYSRSKLTGIFSMVLALMLLFGASYAGAYTGMPTAEEPTGESLPIEAPAPEVSKQPTPGEKLDDLLGNLDEFMDSVNVTAQTWGDKVVEDATKWAEDLSDAWDRVDFSNWDVAIDDGWSMFSSYHIANHTIIHEGFYVDGYIIHLKYDSQAQANSDDVAILEQPIVLLGGGWVRYGDDAAFIATLQRAVDEFVKKHSDLQLRNGMLRLVDAYGPYDESPDALLKRFFQQDKPGHFIAVLNSGKTSQAQREELLYKAAEDGNIACFSILLDDGSLLDKADELLKIAYDNQYFTVFYVLLDYASPETKQNLKDQATRDGRIEYMMGIDEEPSEEAIEALIDSMKNLETNLIAMVSKYLTEAQARRIAAVAYEQNNIGAFSIVMDRLSDEEVEEFNERAHQDKKTAFRAITGF